MSGSRNRLEPANIDLTKIRHPHERLVVSLSVLGNAAIVAFAAALVYFAPEWLSSHGRVSRLVDEVRLAAVAVILLLPALGLLRLGRWAAFRENSVRLNREQVPDLFDILERQCITLGVDPPALYVSSLKDVGLSTSLATGGRRIIVLGPELFAGLGRIQDRADAFEFITAYELGRLALGHASWWEGVLLGYLKWIPVLRMPLVTVQTASRDRFAATLAPDGIRGLLLLVVGGDLLDHVDPAEFVRRVIRDDTPAGWAWLGRLGRDAPDFRERVRELYRAGFLNLDLERVAGADDASAEDAHPPTSH